MKFWMIPVAHTIGFVITYGHAYNNILNGDMPGAKAVGAFFVSLFWPLYWSAEFWS